MGIIYLDEIKWVTDGRAVADIGQPYYWHPEEVLDCRSVLDRGVPGLTAGKFVVCEGPVVPAGAIGLGEPGHTLSLGERGSLATVVGEPVPAITVEQAVERIAVNWTDVTGQMRSRPVQVGRGMRLRFRIGSVRVNRVVSPLDSEWLSTLAIERASYRTWRANALAGRTPPDHHLRCLDYLTKKFGRPHTDFLGSEPDEGVLPFRTSIQCNFNDTNGALESHANDDGGSGHLAGTWAWTVGASDWTIATNQASSIGSDNVATAGGSLSSDDHYSQFGFVSLTGASNLLTTNVRQADASNMYLGGYRVANQWEIFERITGTFTQLGADLSTNAAPATSIRLSVSDSTLELFRDGVSQGTRTDTSLTGTLTTGLRVTSSGAVIDDFEAADLAVGVTVVPQRTLVGVGL